MDRRWEGFNRIVIILAGNRASLFSIPNTILLDVEKYRRFFDDRRSNFHLLIYGYPGTLPFQEHFRSTSKANWWILGNYSGGKKLFFLAFEENAQACRLITPTIHESPRYDVLEQKASLKRNIEHETKRINRKYRAKSLDNFLLRISHGSNPSFEYKKKFLSPSAAKLTKKRKKG